MYYSGSEIGLIVADALREEKEYWNDKWQLTYSFIVLLQQISSHMHKQLHQLGADYGDRCRAEGFEGGLTQAVGMMKLINDCGNITEITELLDNVLKKYKEER